MHGDRQLGARRQTLRQADGQRHAERLVRFAEHELGGLAVHRHALDGERLRVEDELIGWHKHCGGPGRAAREHLALKIDVQREREVREYYLLDV